MKVTVLEKNDSGEKRSEWRVSRTEKTKEGEIFSAELSEL